MKKDLAITALRRAIATRRPKPGLIHHSDRGGQYCSDQYQKTLKNPWHRYFHERQRRLPVQARPLISNRPAEHEIPDSPGPLVHHSDRGIQYACRDYLTRLIDRGVQPSMSRVACPYDNAMAESFMKTLKAEEVDGREYTTIDDARLRIDHFIEQVYNRQRLHSALAYKPPAEFEENSTP